MIHIPAKTGWAWTKEGFSLFKQQPSGFVSIFLAYFLIKQLVSFIPFGDMLSLIAFPVFMMAFMQACVDVKAGKRIRLSVLLTPIKSPRFSALLTLGVLYPVMIYAALGITRLIDDGVLWQLFLGPGAPDIANAAEQPIFTSIIVAALICIPSSMALWYAAPLIMWHDMPLKKALFYSFFAVYKALKAFIVYGIIWGIIIMPFVSLVVSSIAIFVNLQLGSILAFILSILMATVMYCSFYATYITMFDEKENTADKEHSAGGADNTPL